MDTFVIEAVDARLAKGKERFYLVRVMPGGRKTIVGEIYSRETRDQIVEVITTLGQTMPKALAGVVAAVAERSAA